MKLTHATPHLYIFLITLCYMGCGRNNDGRPTNTVYGIERDVAWKLPSGFILTEGEADRLVLEGNIDGDGVVLMLGREKNQMPTDLKAYLELHSSNYVHDTVLPLQGLSQLKIVSFFNPYLVNGHPWVLVEYNALNTRAGDLESQHALWTTKDGYEYQLLWRRRARDSKPADRAVMKVIDSLRFKN